MPSLPGEDGVVFESIREFVVRHYPVAVDGVQGIHEPGMDELDPVVVLFIYVRGVGVEQHVDVGVVVGIEDAAVVAVFDDDLAKSIRELVNLLASVITEGV